ncbi:alginate O-acetyltransferase AlgX-related protein [Parasutterella secunda]|uniref:alginate O-acetyltransferase AlgX-related protein n=1 Tax=Parasutterella secunda TaxID=626947 RepID=UPI0021AD3159|nr:hypothetical protein [Parasutterella secunda]MCR8919780.1 hypothetical protein [Parasutterella secunda]MDM8226226.1 hypothetical protein [Parasutterella secunda]HJI94565.1 hypothetical protein [Sutterellaceae bacterium]
MKRILAIFTVILFVVPFFGSLLIFGEQSGVFLPSENRQVVSMTGIDRFTSHGLKRFFGNKNQYIDDRLMGKEELVPVLNELLLDPEKVSRFDLSKGLIGKNEWIFLGNDYSRVIDKHCQENFPLDNYEFQSSINKIDLLKNTTEGLGGTYVLFIAPDKHNIYCDELPQWLGDTCKNSEIYTRKLISKIEDETSVNVVYPAVELKSQISKGQLFHKSDTHWNLLGGKVGFVALMRNMERLGLIRDFQEIPLMDLKQIRNEKLGDLAHILALPSGYKISKDFDYLFQRPDQLLVRWKEVNKKEELKPFTVSSGSAPSKFYAYMKNESAMYRTKLLVLCDSFNNAMSPYFNLYFSDVMYVSRRSSMDEKIRAIQKFKPTIVINEIVERDLDNF